MFRLIDPNIFRNVRTIRFFQKSILLQMLKFWYFYTWKVLTILRELNLIWIKVSPFWTEEELGYSINHPKYLFKVNKIFRKETCFYRMQAFDSSSVMITHFWYYKYKIRHICKNSSKNSSNSSAYIQPPLHNTPRCFQRFLSPHLNRDSGIEESWSLSEGASFFIRRLSLIFR